jgi:hypothetical protein
MIETDSRCLAWDAYFAGVMSISLHPGAARDGPMRTVTDCACIADAMLAERDRRFAQKVT